MNAFADGIAVPIQAPSSRIRLADLRRRALLIAQLRVLLIGLCFVALTAAALLRIAWLGLVEPAPQARSMAEALLPPRGERTSGGPPSSIACGLNHRA